MRKSAEEIKKEIAYQAEVLFSQKGYAATSMEDICEITERSKGSIYYHFKSKEELFLFVVKQHTYDWLEKWTEKEKQYRTSTEKLYGLAEYHVEDTQHPIFSAVEEFVTSQVVSKDIMDEMIALTRESYRVFETLIEEGMASGEFRQDDVRDLMYIVNGLLSGLGVLYYEVDSTEMKRIYKKAIDVLLQGMAAE
ncbi:TetR family transcriptional regulator C-terminal domain-containing protein [Bacillus sp. DX1.1]|uniref:TetR/AcrR family transcriptional regulator n=1 Tax=unclassified Bacillus (in: firmicutes) TaxID=185979 RepID=UPI002570637C|nr:MULTISPECIES: TetR/AcrR family transcriptional regulator [unclassified Bacillus (in: firmicutes)]MDM5153245.1 TetR family transcriptional regulator C-terminal domain-containing protein [Bacillus sp. DX1.1]MDM5186913.1 TetR family transcriptional regulator C-terminal domain-containing protein [Bacillus sp. DX4.1]WJE82208.1 TetR family transcriptional regulator C-terminal domain-containing protein [Bacillus sp. DX3.1]